MNRKRTIAPYLFMLPALLLLVSIFLIPMVYNIVISLTDWDGLSEIHFIGLQNYIDLFHESVIKEVLCNNLIFY